MDNPFAQVPDDPERLIEIVRREASEEWQTGALPPLQLEGCIRDAVSELWPNPVKTFVPLLALRRVRACIRAGTCDCDDW